jgi:hypothetical protein
MVDLVPSTRKKCTQAEFQVTAIKRGIPTRVYYGSLIDTTNSYSVLFQGKEAEYIYFEYIYRLDVSHTTNITYIRHISWQQAGSKGAGYLCQQHLVKKIF